jgi:hypothetical protein
MGSFKAPSLPEGSYLAKHVPSGVGCSGERWHTLCTPLAHLSLEPHMTHTLAFGPSIATSTLAFCSRSHHTRLYPPHVTLTLLFRPAIYQHNGLPPPPPKPPAHPPLPPLQSLARTPNLKPHITSKLGLVTRKHDHANRICCPPITLPGTITVAPCKRHLASGTLPGAVQAAT